MDRRSTDQNRNVTKRMSFRVAKGYCQVRLDHSWLSLGEACSVVGLGRGRSMTMVEARKSWVVRR